MAALDDILGSNGIDLGTLGARFGLTPEQTRGAMGSLMPAILGGFQKRAQTHDLGPVTEAASGMGTPDADTGNDILGHIFGSKDVSRQVADHAAGNTGLSGAVMQAMLPVVAAMIAKHVAASPASGGLGGMLGSLIGGGAGNPGVLGGIGGNALDSILARLR